MHVLSMYFNFIQVNYLSLSVFLGSLLVLIIFYEMQINASVIFEYITDKQGSFTSNFNFIYKFKKKYIILHSVHGFAAFLLKALLLLSIS